MARFLSEGFDNDKGATQTFLAAVPCRACATGRLPGSHAGVIEYALTDTATSGYTINHVDLTGGNGYYRFYILIQKLPSSSYIPLIYFNGTVSNALALRLHSDGTLTAWSNDATQVGTTSTVAMVENVWYMIQLHIKMRNGGASGTNSLSVLIDGVQVIAGIQTVGSTGINHATQYIQSFIIGGDTPVSQSAHYLIDDISGDTTTMPGPGGVSLLHVTGPGAEQNWTEPCSWRLLTRVPHHAPNNATATVGMRVANTTAGLKQTYAVESMASRGLSDVTIRSHRVVAYGSMIRTGGQYILRKNGIESLSVTFGTKDRVFIGQSGGLAFHPTKCGWEQTVETSPMSPSDTIEIGIKDGPAGAGTTWLTGLYFVVDWEGEDPASLRVVNDAIRVVQGSYIGNGTSQTISFADPTLIPTTLFILPEDTTAASGMWSRAWGEFGDWSSYWALEGLGDTGLATIRTGSFEVVGAASSVNESGVVFRYLVIQDQNQRMIHDGWNDYNMGGWTGTDNVNVYLDDAVQYPVARSRATFSDWPISAIFVMSARDALTPGDEASVYSDVNYTAGYSSWLDKTGGQIPWLDYVQSLGTGVFQIGQSATDGAFDTTRWLAINASEDAFYNDSPLVEVGSYIGNGAASRVITFANTSLAPAWILIVPEVTDVPHQRFFNDGNGTGSRQIPSNVLTASTGIISFATPGQCTVGVVLNVSAAKYHYLVFAGGTDELIVPDIEPITVFEEDLCLGTVIQSPLAHVGIGEIIIGTANQLTGGLTKLRTSIKFPDSGRETTDFGYMYRMQTGSLNRKLIMDFRAEPAMKDHLYQMFDGSVDMNLSMGRSTIVSGGPGESETILSGAPALSGSTFVSGMPYSTYPGINLTDGSSQTVAKLNLASVSEVSFTIDLGSSQTPDFLAIINNNFRLFPSILVVDVIASNNVNMSSPVLESAIGVNYPNMWLDLRGFVSRTARYWRVRISTDPAKNDYWLAGYNDSLTNPLFPPSKVMIMTGGIGKRCLVIPDSRKNDCFWVDIPSLLAIDYPDSLLESTLSFELPEESPGVI